MLGNLDEGRGKLRRFQLACRLRPLQAVYSGDSSCQKWTSPAVPVTVTSNKVSVTVGTSPNGTTDFNFQLLKPNADGITFVIHNVGLSALGGFGIDLGYGSASTGVKRSVAVKFDLYNNSGEGINSTGLYTNGTRPTTPSVDLTSSGINLHSGDIFHVHMTYDGVTLTVIVTDTVTQATETQSYTINIPSTVGSNAAYVGFTAGTGGSSATQSIVNWTYTTP